jgi:hypothetical protein
MHEERIKHLEFELESEKSSRRTFQVENVEAKAEVRRLNDINVGVFLNFKPPN